MNSKPNDCQFIQMALKEAVAVYPKHIHAAHVLFWTKDHTRSPQVVYALMQMRSDGKFGFPGGKSDEECVDENEILSALYREIREEMNYNLMDGEITLEDLLFTHFGQRNGKVLHFFAKELPLEVFENLENTYKSAQSFPRECVGIIRVPLCAVSQPTYQPIRKFFTGFSKQGFAGNAKNQLIDTVLKLNLIGEDDREFVEQIMKN